MRVLTAILTAITVAASLAASQAFADITTRAVTFENEGATLSGTLHLPAAAPGKPLPVVVVTGAWTSVQEQMPRVYAREMVERGFAARADTRHWRMRRQNLRRRIRRIQPGRRQEA